MPSKGKEKRYVSSLVMIVLSKGSVKVSRALFGSALSVTLENVAFCLFLYQFCCLHVFLYQDFLISSPCFSQKSLVYFREKVS
jgi:ABC-type Mn2+/Zn2+ transport system permease subunit